MQTEVQGPNCSLYSSLLGKEIFILFSAPPRKYLKTQTWLLISCNFQVRSLISIIPYQS